MFIKENGDFKVGDFGLSKSCLERSMNILTVTGTHIYMSYKLMEVAMLGNSTGIRHNVYKSDVMSLAITIINMARLEESGGLNIPNSYE
jgi:serine/threonine protein kinase